MIHFICDIHSTLFVQNKWHGFWTWSHRAYDTWCQGGRRMGVEDLDLGERGGGGGWFGLRGGGAIKRCRARPQFPQAQMPSSKEPLSAAKQDFAADLPSNVAFRQWQLTIVNLDLCQKLPSIFVKGCWIERRRKNVRFHPCLILNDLKSMCIVFAVLS